MNRLPHIGRRGNIFFAHGFSGHGALVTTLQQDSLSKDISIKDMLIATIQDATFVVAKGGAK